MPGFVLGNVGDRTWARPRGAVRGQVVMETVTTQRNRAVMQPGCGGYNIAQPEDQGKADWSWVRKVRKSTQGREQHVGSHGGKEPAGIREGSSDSSI